MITFLTKDDATACGMSRGADCCIYLLVGPSGFECARETNLKQTLIARQPSMKSKRMPAELIPDCRRPT